MRVQHWFYTIPLRLRSIFRRRQVERDLDEELQYHLDKKIEESLSRLGRKQLQKEAANWERLSGAITGVVRLEEA